MILRKDEMVWICSMHAGGRRKIHTKLWSENSEHLQDLARDGRMILIIIFRKQIGRVWASIIWFGIKDSGGPL